ncbi:hypothetical protein N7468_010659 [Penicillium chermesinum]|uniref:Cytochrome b561 domain-containing protein n=1 Tax=Penicillium chermesinum TaxID=63820 RepID=A0A9W9N832_9EURO|nr:uncharacterized protein N7468_010659 [Penicillium chermesinum]KAJ5214980.1 hypothetical protein N7468_010659 [Penicillium chermesinum]KAJ6141519.1 hypothetical protein N7470_009909 [Penicillium chermesinum]
MDPSNGSNSGSFTDTATSNFKLIYREKVAHGVLMIVAFVILFPSAALYLRLGRSSNTVAIHGGLQIFALAVAIAGFGLGISLANKFGLLTHYHPIIGIVVVAGLAIFQPAMGLLQHRYFRRSGGKSIFAYLHRWFGRAMLALGIINVGLGFHLVREVYPSDAPWGATIAVSVVIGIVGISYILVVALTVRA